MVKQTVSLTEVHLKCKTAQLVHARIFKYHPPLLWGKKGACDKFDEHTVIRSLQVTKQHSRGHLAQCGVAQKQARNEHGELGPTALDSARLLALDCFA